MAHVQLPPAGTRIANAFNGETIIFTHVEDRDDEARFDFHLARGGGLIGTGRQHLHLNAEEEFIVRDGVLRLMLAGEWLVLGPGESKVVPLGVPHLFRNGHDGETTFTAVFRPANDYLRFFLNMATNTARNPHWYDDRGEPPLVLRALALHAYPDHGYGDGIPIWVQKLVFALLSPIARLRGYSLAVPPRTRRRPRRTEISNG